MILMLWTVLGKVFYKPEMPGLRQAAKKLAVRLGEKTGRFIDSVIIRGTTPISLLRMIEDRTATPRVPVRKAGVSLQWLDDDDVTWHEAPIVSHTTKNGDFVAILRLSPTDLPMLDANGALTVRLRVRRDGAERVSADLKLPQGRVADPSTLTALTFAWDELQA